MEIKDHHLLVSFIISLIKTKMSENLPPNERDYLLILPSCLDYCKMTKEEIEELFLTENLLNFFEHRHSKEKIELMISKEEELNKRIDDLERQMKINETFFNTKIEETKKLFEENLRKIEKFESSQNNLAQKDNEIEAKINNIEKKILLVIY